MNTVNDQITDAVSQVNALLTGNSAAQSMGMLDVAGAETMGMSMFNAVTAQQNSQTSSSAAATASCAKILQTATPVAEPLSSKEKLTFDLLKIEMVEQKAALMLAVEVMFGLYHSANPKTSLSDTAQALTADVNTAASDASTVKIDSALVDSAAKLVDADIDSMVKILTAIEAAKSGKK